MSPLPLDTVLPPWMRNLDKEMHKEDPQQIPLYIEPPMSKEEIAEESDIIEEEGRKRGFIEIDIS